MTASHTTDQNFVALMAIALEMTLAGAQWAMTSKGLKLQKT